MYDVLSTRGTRATLRQRARNAAKSLSPGWRRQEAICILGAPRSGTSAITRVLNLLGVHLGADGDLIPASADNPAGFWEHSGLVRINERVLGEIGGGPASRGEVWRDPLQPEVSWECSPEIVPIARRAELMLRMHFGGARLWGWKDPRTALTLPFWQRIVPSMRYVVCVRNPTDVVRSLVARGDVDVEHGYELWLRYMSAAVKHTGAAPRLVVSYELLLEQTEHEIARMASFIGRPGPANAAEVLAAASSFLTTTLWHHRSAPATMGPDVPPAVSDLYRALLDEAVAEPGEVHRNLRVSRDLRRAEPRNQEVGSGRTTRVPAWLRPLVAFVIEAPVGTARYWFCLSVRVARLAPTRLAHAHLLLACLLAPLRDRVPLLRGRTRAIHLRHGSGSLRWLVGPSTDFDVLNEILVLGIYDLPDVPSPRVILDLGSHIGVSLLRFRTAYPEASIFGLEPDPDTFARLSTNVAQLPEITVMQWAAAARDGRVDFFPQYQSWLSSTEPGDPATSPISVEAVSLDTLFERIGIDRVDLLKLDVEGAEGAILGASRSLHRVGMIVGEVHGDDNFREVCASLKNFRINASGAPEHRTLVARNADSHG